MHCRLIASAEDVQGGDWPLNFWVGSHFRCPKSGRPGATLDLPSQSIRMHHLLPEIAGRHCRLRPSSYSVKLC